MKNARYVLIASMLLMMLAAGQLFAADTKVASSKATDGKAARAGAAITVTGKLTDEGVECQALREDKTKKLYTLTPRPDKKFKNGQRVKVTGNLAENSICQQATTIVVKKIVRLK
jgi:hypothetical protein